MLEAQSNIKQINEARQASGQEEKVSKPDDDPHLMGEAKTAMDDVLDMNDNSCDKLSLEDRVAMLNADQRRIFQHVKKHLLLQQQHEANQCHCDLNPLQMFVSGVGGTGKSFRSHQSFSYQHVATGWFNVCYCSTHWLGYFHRRQCYHS